MSFFFLFPFFFHKNLRTSEQGGLRTYILLKRKADGNEVFIIYIPATLLTLWESAVIIPGDDICWMNPILIRCSFFLSCYLWSLVMFYLLLTGNGNVMSTVVFVRIIVLFNVMSWSHCHYTIYLDLYQCLRARVLSAQNALHETIYHFDNITLFNSTEGESYWK